MIKSKNIAIILTLLLLIISVIATTIHNNESLDNQSANTIANVSTPDSVVENMRGLWVSYISLDMSGTDYSEDAFVDKFSNIIETAKEYNCNTIIAHVRPFCDALYNSDIYPSSHVITGSQGNNLNYDPLEIMCNMSKENNLKIHAWINPYRVSTKSTPEKLSDHNPYIEDNNLGIIYEDTIYLNPAKKASRDLVIEGVKEIILNYNVDGIHFDDYFYPTENEDFDKADYNQYLKSVKSQKDAMPLKEWRKHNVNMLISQVYRTIKKTNPNIVFGISPQGNIDNDLSMGADVKSWCENQGYIDYICPQLYYSIENPALKFEAGLNNWLDFKLHENLKIYAGLAVYKAGTDADNGTWQKSNNVLAEELKLIKSYNLDGFILYDYEALISDNAKEELLNLKKELSQ